METTGIQPSFIPHDAVQAARKLRTDQGGLADLLVLGSIVLCVASIALAIGVFLYQQYLVTSVASKVSQLQRAKAAFEPALISQLSRLDDRMHAADQILSAHVAPLAFFKVLEQITLQTVSFTTLDLSSADAQHMSVKMNGVARSVNSIALQGDLLGKSNVITSPIFSGIDRQIDGVHFNLNAFVNVAAVRYNSYVSGSTESAELPARAKSTTPATPTTPFGSAGGAASSDSPADSQPPARLPATNQQPAE